MSHYFTTAETAKIFDIGYRTLVRWIVDGRFGKVFQTPTHRYKISWSNIEYFCKSSGYPLPQKIPRPQVVSYKDDSDMVDIDSEEGRAILGR